MGNKAQNGSERFRTLYQNQFTNGPERFGTVLNYILAPFTNKKADARFKAICFSSGPGRCLPQPRLANLQVHKPDTTTRLDVAQDVGITFVCYRRHYGRSYQLAVPAPLTARAATSPATSRIAAAIQRASAATPHISARAIYTAQLLMVPAPFALFHVAYQKRLWVMTIDGIKKGNLLPSVTYFPSCQYQIPSMKSSWYLVVVFCLYVYFVCFWFLLRCFQWLVQVRRACA